MSKLSDLSIECQETGRRICDLLPDGKKSAVIVRVPQHPSEAYAIYWRLCLAVVNAAGEVAGKDKLLMNYRDPQKRHSVKDVVDRSFGGEKSAIADKRNENIRVFFAQVDALNEHAVKHGFDQVCGMQLLGMLTDSNTRDRFRYRIKKNAEKGTTPIPLDELLPK